MSAPASDTHLHQNGMPQISDLEDRWTPAFSASLGYKTGYVGEKYGDAVPAIELIALPHHHRLLQIQYQRQISTSARSSTTQYPIRRQHRTQHRLLAESKTNS
jgi:hypothetical protein